MRGIISIAAALREFDSCFRDHPAAQMTAELVREEYRQRIESLRPTRLAFHDHPDSLRHLHVALVAAQRKELIRLWRAQEIGNETLHEIGLIQNFPNFHFCEIRRKQSAL